MTEKIQNAHMPVELFSAMMFAHGAFEGVGQRRKYTGAHYVNHCLEVTELVSTHVPGASMDMLIAAMLHDCIEDTKVTEESIAYTFSPKIAALVVELTDVATPEDGNRTARAAKNRAHIANASPEAQTIKIADIISNSRTIAEHDPKFAAVYLLEKEAQLEVLTRGNPNLYTIAKRQLDESFAQLKEGTA